MGGTLRRFMTASTLAALVSAAVVLRAAESGPALSRIAQAEAPADKTGIPIKPPPTGTPAAVLDDREVEGILGKSIRGSSGESMGRIVDVIVSRSGHVRGAVIDFGGFLGVGSRKIAVDWGALRFDGPDKSSLITVDLTRDQLRVAPEYKPGEPVVILGTAAPVAGPASPPAAQDTSPPATKDTSPPPAAQDTNPPAAPDK